MMESLAGSPERAALDMGADASVTVAAVSMSKEDFDVVLAETRAAGAASGAIEALLWAANAVCNGCRNHMPIAASEICFAQPIHDEIASRLNPHKRPA